jgi:hypothetical protein
MNFPEKRSFWRKKVKKSRDLYIVKKLWLKRVVVIKRTMLVILLGTAENVYYVFAEKKTRGLG